MDNRSGDKKISRKGFALGIVSYQSTLRKKDCGMNIRKKAILTIALVFSFALLTIIILSQSVVLSGFEVLEKNDMETQTGRANDALNQNILSLDALVYNNAAWDATYQFIQDNNSAYINSNGFNLDQTFVNMGINFIVFLDSSGRIIFNRAYSNSTISSNSIVDDVQSTVPNESNLWNFSSVDGYTRGLMNIGGNLFIVASRPIIRSNFTGPVKGALMMGAILSAGIINSLEGQTSLQLEIVSLANNNTPPDFREALANLRTDEDAYVKPDNSSVVGGYILLEDVEGNPCAILGVYAPRNIYQEGAGTVETFAITLIISFVAFAAIAALFLEETVISRVSRLTARVKQITSTERMDQRVVLEKSRFASQDDELSILSTSINKMLDNILETSGKLSKSERFAAIGEIAVMIAHDLRNPLQGIKIATDYLSPDKSSSPEKREKMVQLVKEDLRYCEKIVNDLLDYSREPKTFPSETDVPSLISASLSHLQVPSNVQICDLTTIETKIQADTSMMIRVFDNLVKNAIEAMPEGGKLTIRSEALPNMMRILFEDTGLGIDEKNMNKLFVPLFTTKAKGMGLGLVICKRIMTAHKGTIFAESVVAQGTKITLELPR